VAIIKGKKSQEEVGSGLRGVEMINEKMQREENRPRYPG
jgi:hypothetical protein